jgi:hypothetical protein
MPCDWHARITPDDLDALVAYLRSLKSVKSSRVGRRQAIRPRSRHLSAKARSFVDRFGTAPYRDQGIHRRGEEM